LRWWLISNGLWTSRNPRLLPPASRPEYWWKVIAEVDTTVGKIRSGRLDPYGSVNKLIEYMKKRNKSITCIIGYRGTVLKFLRYSQVGVTDEGGKDYVKRVRRIHLLTSKLPTPDQIRGVLLAAPLKAKVLISTMISTGGRLNEILNIRQDDLDLTRKPAIAYLRGETTKTGNSRITFLSSETVMLIQNYLRSRKGTHQFLFDGYDPTSGSTYDVDKPKQPRESEYKRKFTTQILRSLGVNPENYLPQRQTRAEPHRIYAAPEDEENNELSVVVKALKDSILTELRGSLAFPGPPLVHREYGGPGEI